MGCNSGHRDDTNDNYKDKDKLDNDNDYDDDDFDKLYHQKLEMVTQEVEKKGGLICEQRLAIEKAANVMLESWAKKYQKDLANGKISGQPQDLKRPKPIIVETGSINVVRLPASEGPKPWGAESDRVICKLSPDGPIFERKHGCSSSQIGASPSV